MNRLNSFFKNPPSLLFLLLLFVGYALIGSLCLSFFYLHNWDKSIYTAAFDMGDLLENMVKKGKYQTTPHAYYLTEVPLAFSTHALPMSSYMIYGIIKTTGIDTIGKIMLLKNPLFFSLLALSVYFANYGKNISVIYKWLALLLILIFPRVVLYYFQIDLEESYLIPSLALYWGLISYSGKPTALFNGCFVLSVVLLFFTKHTFVYLCPLLPILYFILFRNKQIVYLTYSLLLVSYLGLGTMNYHNSGVFTVKDCFEGMNFQRGNNELTMKYYPTYSLDLISLIDYKDKIILPKSEVQNEAQFDIFYKKWAFQYMKTHPFETIKGFFIKFFTLFIDIRPNGITDYPQPAYSIIDYLGMFFMLIFRILEWACIITASYVVFSCRKNLPKSSFIYSLGYLLFIGIYCAPYVVAYGFERHIIPLVIPVIFTSLYFLNEFKPKITYP